MSDVIVVGGGPVGLATAIELAARGVAARVLDPRTPPIDKACGEGIMPDGVDWLTRRGVDLAASGGTVFRGIRYLDGEHVAEARFPSGHGLGVRRTALHRALAKRAERSAVELEWGVRALALYDGGVETTAGRREARWIVGADGLGSRVRRWAGLEGGGSRVRRTGIRRHFRIEPWTDLVEVHWADGCEAYVTPVGGAETGVAVLASGGPLGFDEGLERLPALARRLRGARVISTDRGAGPLWRRPRRVRAGRIALVGDAAGYLDAITGEGLALGFHQAEALAASIQAGDLGSYESAVRSLVAVPFALIRLLLFAERHPAIRRRMIRTLEREPELFARFLAIHTRDRPPRSLGVGGAFRFVRSFLGTG